jgi:geranylgeranylglycerol-phosphate geranylgeranyltransferase
MSKTAALFRIIRPVNFIITSIVIAAGYLIASDPEISFLILIAVSFSGALTAASGYIVNDIFDVESDKMNHPERPLASGTITYNSAKIIWFISTLLSFIISSMVSMYAFLAVLAVHVLLIFYSFRLKSIPVFGNIVIALLTSAAFLYGGYAAEYPERTFIPAIFAFLINFIRELVKDIQDVKGDLHTGTITFPGKYGIKKTKKIIIVFIILLLLFTVYPFLTGYYKIEFFIIMMLLVNPFLVYVLKVLSAAEDEIGMKKISGILKLNMAIGLIAIYLGQ